MSSRMGQTDNATNRVKDKRSETESARDQKKSVSRFIARVQEESIFEINEKTAKLKLL